MPQKQLEHISQYAPRGDRALLRLNNEIAGLTSDQFTEITIQRFRDGHWIDIFYQKVPPLVLRSSNFKSNASFFEDDLPVHWEGIFNVPVDPDSITSSNILWVDTDGNETFTSPGAVGYFAKNKGLKIPLPALSMGFVGHLSLRIKNLRNEDGDLADPFDTTFEVVGEDTPLHRQGDAQPYTAAVRSGKSRVARLVVGGGMDHRLLLSDFMDIVKIRDKDVIRIIKVTNTAGEVTEVFLFWYEDRTPRLVEMTPAPGSTMPSHASGEGLVTLKFDEPVDEASMEATGAVLVNDTDVALSGSFSTEKLDDKGAHWAIKGNSLRDRGQKTIKLSNLSNERGEGGENFFLLGWQVLPLDIAGGGGYTDPLTTEGDLLYRNSTATARLGIGTTGEILRVDTAADPQYEFVDPVVGEYHLDLAGYAGTAGAGLNAMTYVAASTIPGVSTWYANGSAGGIQIFDAAFSWIAPPGFNKSVHTLEVRIRANEIEQAANSITIDAHCYDQDQAASTDLVTTNAQTISSGFSDYDFSIGVSTMNAGNFLVIWARFTGNDLGGGDGWEAALERVSMIVS